MPTPRKHKAAQPSLDEWATALVSAAPDAVAGMRAVAKRLAEDSQLSADDRAFAESQLAAIQRAVRRNRQSAKKLKQTIE